MRVSLPFLKYWNNWLRERLYMFICFLEDMSLKSFHVWKEQQERRRHNKICLSFTFVGRHLYMSRENASFTYTARTLMSHFMKNIYQMPLFPYLRNHLETYICHVIMRILLFRVYHTQRLNISLHHFLSFIIYIYKEMSYMLEKRCWEREMTEMSSYDDKTIITYAAMRGDIAGMKKERAFIREGDRIWLCYEMRQKRDMKRAMPLLLLPCLLPSCLPLPLRPAPGSSPCSS